MSAPTVYDFALDVRCYAVRLGASLMNKDVEIRDVDVLPGRELLADHMLALNPKATLPVLLDGEIKLTEPASILNHLARGTSWHTDDAHALDWLFFANDALSVFNKTRHAALFFEPGTKAYDTIPAGTQATEEKLRQLEDCMSLAGLNSQAFLTSNKPSLADILAFPVFAQSRDLRIEPQAYPALRLWARRIRALPGFIGMPGIPDYH